MLRDARPAGGLQRVQQGKSLEHGRAQTTEALKSRARHSAFTLWRLGEMGGLLLQREVGRS